MISVWTYLRINTHWNFWPIKYEIIQFLQYFVLFLINIFYGSLAFLAEVVLWSSKLIDTTALKLLPSLTAWVLGKEQSKVLSALQWYLRSDENLFCHPFCGQKHLSRYIASCTRIPVVKSFHTISLSTCYVFNSH